MACTGGLGEAPKEKQRHRPGSEDCSRGSKTTSQNKDLSGSLKVDTIRSNDTAQPVNAIEGASTAKRDMSKPGKEKLKLPLRGILSVHNPKIIEKDSDVFLEFTIKNSLTHAPVDLQGIEAQWKFGGEKFSSRSQELQGSIASNKTTNICLPLMKGAEASSIEDQHVTFSIKIYAKDIAAGRYLLTTFAESEKKKWRLARESGSQIFQKKVLEIENQREDKEELENKVLKKIFSEIDHDVTHGSSTLEKQDNKDSRYITGIQGSLKFGISNKFSGNRRRCCKWVLLVMKKHDHGRVGYSVLKKRKR